ncbi:interleukin-10 receptor subunit alpha [Brachyhypopomus gauderio]|uniref:interleukin-10 receptor subunit alpha n=1 Tax=Brachyhypopomus gauderio TaxID=698409 RepID=UPI0040427A24
METNGWMSVLFLVLQFTLCISGQNMKPVNVTVHIWEGNVSVTWAPPQSSPQDLVYQTQLSNYDSSLSWETVPNCKRLTTTTCNIGMLPHNVEFVVRVGILVDDDEISWSQRKRFNLKETQLLPPSFSLSTTSHSVHIKVHENWKLNEIFPFGVQYTARLWPDGQENETLIRDGSNDELEMEFGSLRTWRVYCMHVEVDSRTTNARNISSVRCTRLPLDPVLIICFAFLGALGLVTLTMLLVCFLKHPGKTPAALKPIVNGWRPMIVGLDKVEVVTDKGWLLIANQTKIKRQASEEKSADTEEGKERRESMDSGVSMEPSHPSAPNSAPCEQMGDAHVDSGCGSLGGSEGSGGVMEEVEGREDSGLGLGPHEASGCLEGEDIGLLSVDGIGDGYRSQSPESVDMLNESPEIYEMDINMATPSGGYRSGQVICMCSDFEDCVWCKFRKPLDHQSGIQIQSECYNGDGASEMSNYMKKPLIQTVSVIEEDTQSVSPQSNLQGSECSEMLLSLCLQCEENQVIPTDIPLSFTLDDVELDFSGIACV